MEVDTLLAVMGVAAFDAVATSYLAAWWVRRRYGPLFEALDSFVKKDPWWKTVKEGLSKVVK
jgi:hypothetical protein